MESKLATVIHVTLTGISSVFCPLVLYDGPITTEGGPWEDLVTEAAELVSDVLLSFSGFGYRDNEVGRGEGGHKKAKSSYLKAPLSSALTKLLSILESPPPPHSHIL